MNEPEIVSEYPVETSAPSEMPVPVQPIPLPKKLSKAKARRLSQRKIERAAARAGMEPGLYKRLQSKAHIGQLVALNGAIAHGRAQLVKTDELLEKSIAECDTGIAKAREIDDQHAVRDYVRMKKDLMGMLAENASTMIESATIDATDGAEAAGQVVPFGIRQAVVPVNNTQVKIAIQATTPESHER